MHADVPVSNSPFPIDFLGETSTQEQIALGKWQRRQQNIASRLGRVKGDKESMLSNDTSS
jgi:hypothetical protein